MLRRIVSFIMLVCSLAGLAAGDPAASPQPSAAPPPLITLAAPQAPAGLYVTYETEPNNAYTTATPLIGLQGAVQGDILPSGDIDYYMFTATAGQRVFAAVMTGFGPEGDSTLDLIGSDGSTVIETDDDNGTIAGSSSSLAGVVIPSSGAYYLKVKYFGAGALHQYVLHFIFTSTFAGGESELNNDDSTANPLQSYDWITGTRSSPIDVDVFAVSANAGDTIFASLDLYPTRSGAEWDGRLTMGHFGAHDDTLTADDNGSLSSGPDSEALMITVKTAATYYLIVDAAGTDVGSYQLAVSVSPATEDGPDCQTYTSTDAPKAIPSGPSVITSTLNIPADAAIYDLDVNLVLSHTYMADLDAVLVSPAGNTNALFTDVGSTASGYNTAMDITLDDEAASPIDAFVQLDDRVVQPEGEYRLNYFDGESVGGTWSLVIYDDAVTDGGNLLSWGLTVCYLFPFVFCPDNTQAEPVFIADFEDVGALQAANADGFTHSGTLDEWELGLPSAPPLNTCHSGANCWATDLDGTYSPNSSQDLFSPIQSLYGYIGNAVVIWFQKYQLESAANDHAYVDLISKVAPPYRLWEWRGPTMTAAVGSAETNIQESGGWGMHIANISDWLGEPIQLKFHLDSDPSLQYGGLAIDDVIIIACHAAPIYIPLVLR